MNPQTIYRCGRLCPLIVLVVLTLGGCRAPTTTTESGQTGNANTAVAMAGGHAPGAGVEMPHIHGLGYSADGRQLIVPAHDGLRIFADGRWQSPDAPAHDYMGYAPTDDGFYSSGHPHPSTGLVNPLGLIKSADGGRTLTSLGFEGESDFHLMGVGYRSHAIYVLNPQPNRQLPAGLHYSLDDGKTWQQSGAQGIAGQPIQIVAHPTEAAVLALATDSGVYLSSNHGDTFERVGAAAPVTAVTFSPDGTQVFLGSTTLAVLDIGSKQIRALQAPPLDPQDAIAYLAVNPIQPRELAVATFGRDIFRSLDDGQVWEQLAQDGKVR